jgi:hypothetical protein
VIATQHTIVCPCRILSFDYSKPFDLYKCLPCDLMPWIFSFQMSNRTEGGNRKTADHSKPWNMKLQQTGIARSRTYIRAEQTLNCQTIEANDQTLKHRTREETLATILYNESKHNILKGLGSRQGQSKNHTTGVKRQVKIYNVWDWYIWYFLWIYPEFMVCSRLTIHATRQLLLLLLLLLVK